MKKIFALLTFGWFLCQTSSACGPFERVYLAKDYFTFRLCGDDMTGQLFDIDKRKLRRVDNCKSWAKLTSTNISVGDIEEVVYRWNSHQLQSLRQQMVQHLSSNSENVFARWLTKHNDLEIVDFLLTAKLCEETRDQQFTAWYYPVEGDELHQRLAQVVEKAKGYEGQRLKDRYALQAIRALFASQEYRKCVEYWNREQVFFKKGTLRDMAIDYVAGCLIRTNQPQKATQLYAENGDGQKALQIQKGTREERFDWLYQYNPNDPCLLTQMQQFVHDIERWEDRWDGQFHSSATEYAPLYQRVKRICQEKRCRDMSPWYYTMAFLADKTGKTKEGICYIQKAETAVRQQELSNSIRVLKTYLTTKATAKYTEDFERYLFGELQWMDQMIRQRLDNFTKNHIIANGAYKHICGISQYYWNDMLRKIVISEVVPLCLRSGYQTRALQYLNMADNRIFNLTRFKMRDSYSDYEYAESPGKENFISWKDFRLKENLPNDYVCNEYDYQNDFFINLDSLDVMFVKRLQYRMTHPICELDHFLTERSYTDPQFYNDIIGTKLIAAARYAEAVPYLEKISERFNKSRNIYPYCKHDPFTMKRNDKPDAFYRLHFAQRMVALERKIAATEDNNEKAELMLSYVYGMKNSMNYRCWALTSYYWGDWDCFPFHSHHQKQIKQQLSERAESMKHDAFALFTNDDRAAQAYLDWCMYKTAVKKYPKSKTAKQIRGHCDVLRDYKI